MVKDGKLSKHGEKIEGVTPADWSRDYVDYTRDPAQGSAPEPAPATGDKRKRDTEDVEMGDETVQPAEEPTEDAEKAERKRRKKEEKKKAKEAEAGADDEEAKKEKKRLKKEKKAKEAAEED